MFKITKSVLADTYGVGDAIGTDFGLLSQFCRVESWSADLSTGIFKLGPLARNNHGLNDDIECGLLTLIRCYKKEDQFRVLEIMETASVSPSRFCYSTETNTDNSDGNLLFCMGESMNFTEAGAGEIQGVFLFPRLSPSHDIVVPMIRQ